MNYNIFSNSFTSSLLISNSDEEDNRSIKKQKLNDGSQFELSNGSSDESSIFSESIYNKDRFNEYLKKYTFSISDIIYSKKQNKNDNISMTFSDELGSESELILEKKIEKATQNLHEIFVEGCCALYNDLLNLLDDFDCAAEKTVFESNLCDLEERHSILMRQANELTEKVPEFSDTVNLRLITLGRSMKQLRIRHDNETALIAKYGLNHHHISSLCSSNSNMSVPQSQFRKWLQASETELKLLKTRINNSRSDLINLQRLQADNQVLQLQIETEGRALLNSAHQQIIAERKSEHSLDNLNENNVLKNLKPVSKRVERWHRNLEVLEHRWYAHWLTSLESLELISQFIDQLIKLNEKSDSSETESDLEQEEPLHKRLKCIFSSDLFVDEAFSYPKNYEKSSNKQNFNSLVLDCSTVKNSSSIDVTTNCTYSKEKNEKFVSAMTNVEHPLYAYNEDEFSVATTITQSQTSDLKENKSCSSGIESFSTPSTSTCVSPRHQIFNSNSLDVKLENEHDGTIKNCNELNKSKIFLITDSNLQKSNINFCEKIKKEGVESSASSSRSSNHRFHDIGYSSGENNSLYEVLQFPVDSEVQKTSLNQFKNCDVVKNINNDVKLAQNPNNSFVQNYYKTVPLDEGGVTDTEMPQQSSLFPTPFCDLKQNNLTDSLIVQVDSNSNNLVFNKGGNLVDESKSIQPNSSFSCLDDFEQVMQMMDEQFKEQLEILKRGTQWRELKSSNRRSSVEKKHQINSLILRKFSTEKETFCDASCEDSDTNHIPQMNAKNLTSSFCCDNDVMTSSHNSVISNVDNFDAFTSRRKRHHKRSSQNIKNVKNFTKIEKKKQENLLMNQSIYITETSNVEKDEEQSKIENELENDYQNFMSRSLNITNNNNFDTLSMSPCTIDCFNNKNQTSRIRKKILRSKMYRSVSDNSQLSTLNTCKNSFSRFIKQHLKTEASNENSLIICNAQLKNQFQQISHHSKLNPSLNVNEKNFQRRSSIESSHSSSSVNTIHETGDAHYEWDDYKDSCNLLMPPSCNEHDNVRHSTPKKKTYLPSLFNSTFKNNINTEVDLSILSQELVASTVIDDEDFGAELPELLIAQSDIELNLGNNINNNNNKHLSETELYTMLTESRNAFNSIENMLKKMQQRKGNSRKNIKISKDNKAFIRSTANENLEKLFMVIQMNPIDIDMDQITEVEKLRRSWAKLLAKVLPNSNKKTHDNCNNSVNSESSISMSIFQLDFASEDNISDAENNISLHSILNNIKIKLNLLMKNECISLSLDDIEKVVETRKDILNALLNYRNDLHQLLKQAQHNDSFNIESHLLEKSDVTELMMLIELVEKFLNSIQSSTMSLEKLRSDFSLFVIFFKSLEKKIDKLCEESKNFQAPSTSYMSTVEFLSDECTASLNEFTKDIETELMLCQERMNSLETVCNTLSSQLISYSEFDKKNNDTDFDTSLQFCTTNDNKINQDFFKSVNLESTPFSNKLTVENIIQSPITHSDFLTDFIYFRKELNKLKDRFKQAVLDTNIYNKKNDHNTILNSSPITCRKRRFSNQEINLVSIGTQSDISAETFRTYEARINEDIIARKNARAAKLKEIRFKKKLELEMLAKEKKRIDEHFSSHTLIDETIKESNGTTKFVLESNNIVAQTVKFPQSLSTILRNNRLAQFCFGCSLALLVGFLLFTLLSGQTERNPMLINNYRWSFGLQLDYKRGPPPI